jgi:adenylate cyclase
MAGAEDVEALIERTRRTFSITITLANVIGAAIVFVFLLVILPVRGGPPVRSLLEVNVPVGIAFLALACWLGPRFGRAIADRNLAWLRQGRAPSPEEQRRVLRSPIRQLVVPGTLWALAAVVFGLINLPLSDEVASRMVTAMVMGGLSTCAASYLLGERVLRPVTARALASGAPAKPVVPGVMARTVLTWALASGVPIVGIAMVASGVLVGDTPRSDATMWSVIFLSVVAILFGAAAIAVAARSIAEPIRSVREGLRRVEQGDLDVDIPVWDASEVGLLQAGFNRMGAGLREREQLQDLFGRYVGEDVARRALDAGVELGGEVREAAVLFVDVIGSTKLAAEAPPEEVVNRLNAFFGLVLGVVREHDGWVNKFEGDAALCVFGVPTESDDPAGSALAAARELADRLRAESPLEAGVGVSFGEVVAGNVGAAERFEYTVIGDPVNEAARLTERAKGLEPHVVASEAAVRRASADEAARWEPAGELTLRGRSAPTRLYVPARRQPA